jgi:hypothetical protein
MLCSECCIVEIRNTFQKQKFGVVRISIVPSVGSRKYAVTRYTYKHCRQLKQVAITEERVRSVTAYLFICSLFTDAFSVTQIK